MVSEDMKLTATRAQCHHGIAHGTGDGVQREDVKASEWFTKAAASGSQGAKLTLAQLYGKGSERDNADVVEKYRTSSNRGDPKGMLDLGDAYFHGNCVDQDCSLAVAWYRKAAEQVR